MASASAVGVNIHSVDGRRRSAEMLAAAQRLNVLDDVWTTYLASAEPRDPAVLQRDLPELERLVADMQLALGEVVERAQEFRFLYEETTSDEIDEALGLALAAQSAPEDVLREQLAPVLEEGDFRGAVISGCIYIVNQADAERARLGEKLATLQRGEFREGDLGLGFKCALFVVAAGAAIASPLVPAGVGVVLATVGVVSGCICSWKDCREKWREIRQW